VSQSNDKGPGEAILVIVVTLFLIYATVAEITNGPSRTSSEKAADKIVDDSQPKRERICLDGDEYVISSKCP
jgi:hypothetical protein